MKIHLTLAQMERMFPNALKLLQEKARRGPLTRKIERQYYDLFWGVDLTSVTGRLEIRAGLIRHSKYECYLQGSEHKVAVALALSEFRAMHSRLVDREQELKRQWADRGRGSRVS